jgi:hypothetical protein
MPRILLDRPKSFEQLHHCVLVTASSHSQRSLHMQVSMLLAQGFLASAGLLSSTAYCKASQLMKSFSNGGGICGGFMLLRTTCHLSQLLRGP